MSTKQKSFLNLRQGKLKPQARFRDAGYNPYDTAGSAFYQRLMALKVA